MSHKFMGIGLWYLCKRVDAKQLKLNIKYIHQVTGKAKVLRSDKEAIFLVAAATLQEKIGNCGGRALCKCHRIPSAIGCLWAKEPYRCPVTILKIHKSLLDSSLGCKN